MTDRSLSWIAGFYEGEGSCGCYRKTCYVNGRKYVYPRGALAITIAQKDKKILEWIQKQLGVGTLNCRTQKNPTSFGHRLWYWTARHKAAEKVLRLLRPLMKIKRRQRQMDKALRLYRGMK